MQLFSRDSSGKGNFYMLRPADAVGGAACAQALFSLAANKYLTTRVMAIRAPDGHCMGPMARELERLLGSTVAQGVAGGHAATSGCEDPVVSVPNDEQHTSIMSEGRVRPRVSEERQRHNSVRDLPRPPVSHNCLTNMQTS